MRRKCLPLLLLIEVSPAHMQKEKSTDLSRKQLKKKKNSSFEKEFPCMQCRNLLISVTCLKEMPLLLILSILHG